MERLIATFNKVKTCYFPRWDIKKEWTIKIRSRKEGTNEVGYCDLQKKEICVNTHKVNITDADLYVLLIHEICHAVVAPGHGKKFQSRLLKAADKAQNEGEIELAKNIRTEVKLYQDLPTITAREIYTQISDAVLDQPDALFDTVIAWVADNYSQTPDEILKIYRKAEDVFNATKKQVVERAAFTQKMSGVG